MAFKIKKGDTIRIIAGKDHGKTGTVARVLSDENRVVVDGMNMRKRHVRPRASGAKGEIIQIPAPMNSSNVMIVCPKCGKATRVGYRVTDTAKARVCKKCKADL